MDKAKDLIGEGCQCREQQGGGTQNCSAKLLGVLGFMVTRLAFQFVSGQSSWLCPYFVQFNTLSGAMKVKEEGEKVGLKLNIQKTKTMESGPITSWEIDGEKWKQSRTLSFLAPKSLQKVTAAMKLKMVTPWKESYDQPR